MTSPSSRIPFHGEPLDQRVEHEPPPGLREEPLDLLVVGGHRDKLSAAEQQAGGHEAVDVWIPLGLISEALDRRRNARDAVLSVEHRPEAALDRLEGAAGEEAEEPALPEEEPSQRDRDREDAMLVLDGREDLLAELLREEIHAPSIVGETFGTGLLPEAADCLLTDGLPDPGKTEDPAFRERAAELMLEIRDRELEAAGLIEEAFAK